MSRAGFPRAIFRFLFLIHAGIRVREELVKRTRMFRIVKFHPRAERQRIAAPRLGIPGLDVLVNTLNKGPVLAAFYRMFEHEDRKLVPAQAADDVRLAEYLLEDRGGFKQRQIALGVAERVVDLFQPIEVRVEEQEPLPGPVRQLELLLGEGEKTTPVKEVNS